MSGVFIPGSGIHQEDIVNLPDIVLPRYFAYLSMVFKLIATLMIILMAGWVIATIKKTRSLHRPHNIFVANLMVADILMAVLACSLSTAMTTTFMFGEDFVSCSAFKLSMIPANVIGLSYVMISVDTVIAITFPFKHKQIMTPYVIIKFIISEWMLAIVPFLPSLFLDVDGYNSVAEYSFCTGEGAALIESLLIYLLPAVVTSCIALALNIYVTIKTYQIYKKSENENRLSGTTESSRQATANKALRKKGKAKKQLKPMITMLVIASGGIFFSIIFPPLYFLIKLLINSVMFANIMDYIVMPNIFYIGPLLHPFVYGLYFQQTCEPMMKSLRTWFICLKCNSASVAPQTPRM